MNNIIFSKLTKKQIINLYENKEYNKIIRLLTMIFTNRNHYKEYLNKNEEKELFSKILYMWEVREEFKALLNNKIDELTVNYLEAINEDYIKYLFTEKEIAKLKEELEKYYYQKKNSLIVNNYINGNFRDAIESIKHDYDSVLDFEAKIKYNNSNENKKIEIPVLRELYHITNKIDFSKSKDYLDNYYYGMLKNLIFIYENLSIEYVSRYLLRQIKLGVDFNELFNSNILDLFDDNDKNDLINIYNNSIKNGIKEYKGRGLYNITEYGNPLHMFTTILELKGNIDDIYYLMFYNFKYKAGELNAYLKRMNHVLNIDSKNRLIKINNGYSGYIVSEQEKEKIEKRNKQIDEISKIIEVLIEDDINIDVYFSKSSTLKEEFRKIIDFMKENTPALYSKYLDIKNCKIEEASLKVAEAIRNNPNFNEIDYYMITNIPYEDIRKYLNKKDFDAYLSFSEFVKSVSDNTVISEKNLGLYINLSTKFSFKNSVGETIVVKPTKEDKINALNFLNNIGAPITDVNIESAIKRNFLDSIDIDKSTSSKVKEYKIG